MIQSKLPAAGTTIFTVMSKLAAEHQALNLAQGFPGFNCNERLIELAYKYMKQGMNQYAPMAGVVALRERLSEKTLELYNHYYNPESEITITAGATEAVYTAITSIINPGDEVILFEPAFDIYKPAILLSGGRPVTIKLSLPDYQINWEEVKKKINSKTKLIIINSPHNPTGAVISAEDIEELKTIVRDTAILILSDEVYEHIIFDDKKHESLINHKDLINKTLVAGSLGKTFHVTGWRIGYCPAPPSLTAEFRKVHQSAIFAANTPMQYAIAEFLEDKSQYLDLPSFFQNKRDLFLKFLKGSKWEVVPSHGTYFQLLSYKNISREKDTDLAVRLTKELGVASIPVSVFYDDQQDDKILRFCFAKDDDILEQAAEKLWKI